jgi:hypothetical protein
MTIKQFKLTNNDEIICEVVEWDTGDESGDVLIKKALKVVSVEDYQRGWRFFAFRPWMSFQDDPESMQTLNSSHIIVTTIPSKNILKHYKRCLDSITEESKTDNIKSKKVYANLDEIQNELRDLTDDEMDDFLIRKYGAVEEDYVSDSDDNNKIIKFKPRNTFH